MIRAEQDMQLLIVSETGRLEEAGTMQLVIRERERERALSVPRLVGALPSVGFIKDYLCVGSLWFYALRFQDY